MLQAGTITACSHQQCSICSPAVMQHAGPAVQSVIGCYTEHRPFEEPTKGSLGSSTGTSCINTPRAACRAARGRRWLAGQWCQSEPAGRGQPACKSHVKLWAVFSQQWCAPNCCAVLCCASLTGCDLEVPVHKDLHLQPHFGVDQINRVLHTLLHTVYGVQWQVAGAARPWCGSCIDP